MRKGFTLIELMIVIAIIAIIASIAIPNLLESRITANEGAASASIKSAIFASCVQFQAGGYQDSNSNGVGEYGYIQQMNGNLGSIGATGAVIAAGVVTTRGDIGLLTGPLATNNLAGAAILPTASANNYNFSMFLPNGDNTDILFEGDALPTLAAPITEPQMERSYVVAAAPQTLNEVGRRIFLMAADGQLRSTSIIANRDTWFVLVNGKMVNNISGVEMEAGILDVLTTDTDIDSINSATYPFYSK